MTKARAALNKCAVVLFNIGGPDKVADIYPFLRNFFADPAILRLPPIFRKILGYYIAITRSKGEALKNYQYLGGKSPLLLHTKQQAVALEQVLNNHHQVKCFVSMRYWHPMSAQTVEAVQKYNPDKVILLPLYPQYSTSTTASSFEDWGKSAQKAGLKTPTHEIEHYPTNAGFIAAGVEQIQPVYQEALSYGHPKLLFSAHSLPKSFIRKGDPYQAQCQKTAAALVDGLGISDLDWSLCYQSQLSEKRWIGPSIAQELKQMEEARRPVVIFPLAFVSEHVETLAELDIVYRERSKNIPYYGRVKTVGCHEKFIAGLAGLVLEKMES